MTLRQWVIIELLALANGLAVVVAGLLLFLTPAAAVLSHNPVSTQVVLVTGLSAASPAPLIGPAGTQTPAAESRLGLILATPAAVPTDTPGPALNASVTPTSVVPGLSATPAPTGTSIPTESQPYRLAVEGHPQSLPLSCEARSAVDWAAYFGFNIDELEFFGRLPATDDPEVGFVGDVNGHWGQVPPNAYGVHAGPVAALLREYGVNAQADRDLAWEAAQFELRSGRPVVVWVVGHVWQKGRSFVYTAADGAQVLVAPYEHTVILIGYDETQVFLLDGDKIYSRPIAVFLSSWSALGNMAVTLAP